MNRLRERITESVSRLQSAPRYISIPVGVGFIIGGTLLAPLPIFGMWMAPLGVAILAPHSPHAARLSIRMRWWSLRALKWAIRHDFVRVKRKSAPPADAP